MRAKKEDLKIGEKDQNKKIKQSYVESQALISNPFDVIIPPILQM
jgi:hypothetical protein